MVKLKFGIIFYLFKIWYLGLLDFYCSGYLYLYFLLIFILDVFLFDCELLDYKFILCIFLGKL